MYFATTKYEACKRIVHSWRLADPKQCLYMQKRVYFPRWIICQARCITSVPSLDNWLHWHRYIIIVYKSLQLQIIWRVVICKFLGRALVPQLRLLICRQWSHLLVPQFEAVTSGHIDVDYGPTTHFDVWPTTSWWSFKGMTLNLQRGIVYFVVWILPLVHSG